MLRYLIFALFFSLSYFSVSAQRILTAEEAAQDPGDKKRQLVRYTVEQGDTAIEVYLNPITIFPERVFKNRKEQIKYTKMILNVKKVYPYSILISKTVNELEANLSTMKTDKERKAYLKLKEKELTKNFEKDIRDMTFTQGRILIKLVDRQTGQTSYDLVKRFKGNITAMFWQSIARIFSTNLKYEYDSEGEDLWIEEIVAKIENGLL